MARVIMGAMSEAIKTIVRRVVNEMLVGKPELASELFSPAHAEKQALLGRQLVQGFPDLQMKVEELIVEGNKAACRWSATGTQRGSFLGIKPTNVRVSWTGTSMYRIEGGKIVDTTTNWDAFELIQQLHKAATGT
jgi:hypothetical protein